VERWAPALPFFAPHYRRYLQATAPPLTGVEQQQRITGFRAAFPDLHFTVADMVAEGDRVVFRATMCGTHHGMFRGIAPTGKQVTVAVLDVVRIEQGMFAEQWGGPNLWELLEQLGAGSDAKEQGEQRGDSND
jgi:predicted ester cyclase